MSFIKTMFFKIIYVSIYLLSSYISATNVCLNNSPCKCVLSAGNVIDLSSVGRTDHPRFYEVRSSNENDTQLYSYNPCYDFDSPEIFTDIKSGSKPCKAAAACVRTPGGNNGDLPKEFSVGVQSEAKFGSTKELGYHINYTVPGANQRLMVLLSCTNETDILTVENSEIEDNFVLTLRTKCACPNGCVSVVPSSDEHGLSTGSKLLIAFFTLFLAYFVIGIVWNFFNGAHGLELVPNHDFWNELPKLIIEGLVFTCSCFGKKTSYGEV